ncbi:hypothetical protein [Streptomyces sclerotialus]|uniref:hypothetical protein n=1 Tax=Streptomyces sclerotialus TaxID=1957 RepID=UPI0034A2DEF4
MKIDLKPEQIPQYTGNLPELEKDHAALKADAGHLRTTGAEVHSRFQGLSAYYKAPEAGQLFASTKPVQTRADEFADGLETVASALSAYAEEIRPLVPKLQALKRKAEAFIRDHKDDEDGDYDEDLIAEHNRIRDDITATVAAFWAAERTCHNKIVALWNGPKMVAGDGSEKKNQYGFSAEDMKNAKLPWGNPVEEKHHWYEVGHWVKSFVWDGLIVDGIWGTIKGLGTLVGFGGWDAMGQAWKGLAQLATGLAISSIPGVGTAFWALPDDKMPSWLRDSRTAMKETGKALVAWDEWGKNPGRAAGAVTFNVVTTVFTGGAGGAAAGAGKAGAVAKALSVAGKAGKVIDPMTYVAKGAGAGLSKIGDIAKSIKGIGRIDVPALPADAIKLPEGSVRLSDGTVSLPEGAAVPAGATKLPDGNVKLPDDVPALPENAAKLPTDPGEPARYFDGDGNLLDEHGNTVQHAVDAPQRLGDSNIKPTEMSHVDSPVKEPALVGEGSRALDDAGRTGDSAARETTHSTGASADRGAYAQPVHSGHSGDGTVHGGDHASDAGRATGHTPDGPHAHGPDGHHPPSDEHVGSDHTPDGSGRHAPDGGADHVPDGHDGSHPSEPVDAFGRDAADMGTRRGYEARVAPESTIPAPPKEPGDLVLSTGDPVYFREGRTAIGYDRNTRVNFDYVKPLDGYHDVVVHGNNQGFFEPGRVNEAGAGFPAGDTHPTHIADAIRANPSYDGGPVRLVSCHTGTVAEGALDIPAAQSVANELGVPVMAPTNKVGVSGRLGPGQTPTIFGGGYWRTFLPMVR